MLSKSNNRNISNFPHGCVFVRDQGIVMSLLIDRKLQGPWSDWEYHLKFYKGILLSLLGGLLIENKLLCYALNKVSQVHYAENYVNDANYLMPLGFAFLWGIKVNLKSVT